MTMLKRFYLMTSSLAVAGMVTAPLQAMAQDAPGPGGDNAAPYNQAGGDPPTRVGRLATMDGTVSTHGAGDDHWSPATLNAPVATGDAYWTEPSALAKIEMTASAVWMDASTEFDLTTLDDTTMHAAEPQGELYLQLRSLQPGETFTIETPRGTVTMATDGSYDIAAGDTDHPTTVTVLDGAASITGSNISLQVHADQTASVTGSTTFDGTVGPAVQDDFLVSMRKREAPAQVSGAPPPPIVAQMTGGDDLVQYGAWQDDQDYGQVWYPQVGSDWVPYREGRWSYVAPWGWTWEDNAPWGFAPFHYGRWVQVGPRWGWVPGYAGYGGGGYGRPAYAPALVGFFGIGLGVGIGIGEGFRPGANVGWVPLGPREAYYPPYRASRTYLTRVNVTNIRNVTNITNEEGSRRDLGIDRYTNARAATVVPARAMQDSRPIAGAYRRPTAAELAGARGVVDRAPIAPGARTAGLTPHTAEAMRISDYRPRTAPGPQVSARPEHAGRGNLPALREAHGSAEHPAAAPGPELRGERTPGGLPALRTPGERPDRPAASDAATGAPGPRIAHGTEAGRPALRAPGAEREARPAPNAGEMAHTPSERHPAAGTTPGSAVTHREATTPDHAEPARRESAAHTPAPRPTEPAAPVHQPRAEPKAQPRPEPRAEPRPEPRAQPRPEPRPEPRAEPRPQPRVEAPRPPPPPAPAPRPAPKPPQKGEPPH